MISTTSTHTTYHISTHTIHSALQHAIALLRIAYDNRIQHITQKHSAQISQASLETLDSHTESNSQTPDISSQAPHIFPPRFRLEAEILLAHTLNTTRVWLHTHSDESLQTQTIERFFALIQERAQGYPIEYLTQCVSFLDMELFITQGALIPRPESEILIHKVCEIARLYPATKPLHLIEVGTGSGALSIGIARWCKNAHIIATDISEQALDIARQNLAHFTLEDPTLRERVRFKQASLLGDIDTTHTKIVFSNPPYIARSYPIDITLSFEPQTALFGGENGDEILRDLIAQCSARSIPHLVCEMGYDQKSRMQQALSTSGYQAEFYTDFAGLDRGFCARYITT